MGFQTAVAGLNVASKALDVTGNNIANSQTVGFKAARSMFADIYANSLLGYGGTQIGAGATVNAVWQQFTQGTNQQTGNALDMAINGNGFYRLQGTDGSLSYTRNGQFNIDKNGYLVNANGKQVTGWNRTNFNVVNESVHFSAFITPIQIGADKTFMPPHATQDVANSGGAQVVGLKLAANLDARITPPTTTKFDPSDPSSYNNSTTASIFDSTGVAHSLEFYFSKAGAASVTSTQTVGTTTTTPGTAATTVVYHASLASLTPAVTSGTLPAGLTGFAAPSALTAADFPAGCSDITYTVTFPALTTAGTGTATVKKDYITDPNTWVVRAFVDLDKLPDNPSTDQVMGQMVGLNNTTPARFDPATGALQPGSPMIIKFDGSGNPYIPGRSDLADTVFDNPVKIDDRQFQNNPGSVSTPGTPNPAQDAYVGSASDASRTAAIPYGAFHVDLRAMTQYGTNFGVTGITQNGYSAGNLVGLAVDKLGVISGQYSNGQTSALGQVALSTFTNPVGLYNLGDNQWAESNASGQPVTGTPNSGILGTISPAAVETSNVDLNQELVNLIIQQRAYQANAQTISRQDQALQSIINVQ